jgi:hypothetical protein
MEDVTDNRDVVESVFNPDRPVAIMGHRPSPLRSETIAARYSRIGTRSSRRGERGLPAASINRKPANAQKHCDDQGHDGHTLSLLIRRIVES